MTAEGALISRKRSACIWIVPTDVENPENVLFNRKDISAWWLRFNRSFQSYFQNNQYSLMKLQRKVKECYDLSWKLGLKATALYRDGCKLSNLFKWCRRKILNPKRRKPKKKQLSGTNIFLQNRFWMRQEESSTNRWIQNSKDSWVQYRSSETAAGSQRRIYPESETRRTYRICRTGEYGDGTGEILCRHAKEGASFRSLMNCFAISVSIGLQYGVPLEEFVEKFIFTRFSILQVRGSSKHQIIYFCHRLYFQVTRVGISGKRRSGPKPQRLSTLPETNPAPVHQNNSYSAWNEPDIQADQNRSIPEFHDGRCTSFNSSCGHITIRSGLVTNVWIVLSNLVNSWN